MSNLTSSSSSPSDDFSSVQLAIVQEHLRQAKIAFNMSSVVNAVSIGISVMGAVLLLSGKVSEGAVATASGLLTSGVSSQVAKDASDKLGRLSERLENIQQN